MDVKFIRVTGWQRVWEEDETICAKTPHAVCSENRVQVAGMSVQGLGREVIGDEDKWGDTVRKCHKYCAGELGFYPGGSRELLDS